MPRVEGSGGCVENGGERNRGVGDSGGERRVGGEGGKCFEECNSIGKPRKVRRRQMG